MTPDSSEDGPLEEVTNAYDRQSLGAKLSWLLDNTADPNGRRWSLRSLSDATGHHGERMSHATIGKIADGSNDNPRLRTVETLARTFGVSLGLFSSDASIDDAATSRSIHNPRIRKLLTLMEGFTDADLDLIEALVTQLRSHHDARAAIEQQSAAEPPQPPRRPGKRRRYEEAARRAAKSLEP